MFKFDYWQHYSTVVGWSLPHHLCAMLRLWNPPNDPIYFQGFRHVDCTMTVAPSVSLFSHHENHTSPSPVQKLVPSKFIWYFWWFWHEYEVVVVVNVSQDVFQPLFYDSLRYRTNSQSCRRGPFLTADILFFTCKLVYYARKINNSL